jgi:hypothetical protein
MKLSDKIKPSWMVLVAGVTIVTAVCIAEDPIENLRVVLECYPTGEAKTELFAKLAEVPPNGDIIASGLVLKEFLIDGSVHVEIHAEDCTFNQETQVASSTNKVSLQSGDVVVTGKGFDWNGTDKKLKILKKAKVVFPTAIVKDKGALEHVHKK